MRNPDENKLEHIERELYSRRHSGEFKDERSEVVSVPHEVESEWREDKDISELVRLERERREEERSRLFKKIFVGALTFFIVAAGAAAFMFFGGANLVSSNNIDIAVIGPSAIAGGDTLSLEIVVKNQNRASLEGASLLVEYPAGTRAHNDLGKELIRERVNVGSIPARGEARKTLKSVLFGEKESIQNIKLTLEYRIEGGSATVAGFAAAIYWIVKSIFQLPISRWLDKTDGENDEFWALFYLWDWFI